MLAVFLGRLRIKSKQHAGVGKNTISIYKAWSTKNISNDFLNFKFLLANSNSDSFIRV